MNIEVFFPQGTKVFALPNWQNPRLILPADFDPFLRWKKTELYPAYRWSARVYRLFLRAKSYWGGVERRSMTSQSAALEDFLAETSFSFFNPVILVGTPGPTQKLTIQLWNAQAQIIAYLKYSEKKKPVRVLNRNTKFYLNCDQELAPRF